MNRKLTIDLKIPPWALYGSCSACASAARRKHCGLSHQATAVPILQQQVSLTLTALELQGGTLQTVEACSAALTLALTPAGGALSPRQAMWTCVGGKLPAGIATAPDCHTGATHTDAPLLEGTVAICGWFGCTEKNLEKYAACWRERGWQPVLIRIERNLDVLTLRATLRYVHASYRRLAATQAAVVQRGGSARVMFHAFSMVGWSLYSLLLQDMAAARSSPRAADVCGAVLDSTPDTAPGPRLMAAAFYTVLDGKLKSRKEMQSTATFRTLKAFFTVWTRPGGQSWREVKQIIDFVKENENYPQLYIYSAADVVVLSSSVEAHMQRQRQRGCAVRSLRLEDTPHCGHFRSHRAQYRAAVAAFLQHDVEAVSGRHAEKIMAPSAYISLAEAAGAGKAEGLSTPRGACMNKAGAAAAVPQPATPDIAEGRPHFACN